MNTVQSPVESGILGGISSKFSVALGVIIPSILKQLFFADNKTAYYTEDEWSGHSHLLKDYSRNVGSLRDERLGYCYDFTGASTYINTGIMPDIKSQRIIFSWYQKTTTSGSVFSQGGFAAVLRGYYVSVNGSINFKFGNGSVLTYGISEAINLLDDQWHYIELDVTMPIDDVPSQLTIHSFSVDGVSYAVVQSGVFGGVWALPLSENGTLVISGRDGGATGPRVTGRLRDVKMQMHNGSNTYIHYPLQEETGTRAYDISGNGHHGTITNAVTSGVGSIHQPDAGVTKSYPNDEGYSPAFTINNTLLTSGVSITKIEFDVVSNTDEVVLFSDSNLKYLLALDQGSTALALSGSFGSPVINIDGSVFSGNRGALHSALSDGDSHHVIITNITYSDDLYYGGYSGIPSSFDLENTEVTNLFINDVPLYGTSIVPAKSPTQDALGSTLTYTGEVPKPGLVKDYGWQGNGTNGWVSCGAFTLDMTKPWSVEIPLYIPSSTSGDRTFLSGDTNHAWRLRDYVIEFNFSGFTGGATALRNFLGITAYLDKWTIVRLDWDGVNTGSLYLDGVFARSGTMSAPGTLTNIWLGQRNGPGTENWLGGIGPTKISIDGVTTTFAFIPGTRNVAILRSDGTSSVRINAVQNGVDAELYTLGDGSWRSPAVENGGHWDGTSLIPAAPGASVAANGNPINIPPNKHPRGVLVDRTGGIISPADYQMSTDGYTDETFYEVPPEDTIDKRITTNYADRYGAGFTDVSGNSYYNVTQSYHPFATTYLNNVVAADGEALERQVALLYNELILGCIEDDIWEAIKASCVLAGARTLAGCLVPLVGAAPTNYGFVQADYGRVTGLKGNAVKYLGSGRNNNADPQDNKHIAAWKTADIFGVAGRGALVGTAGSTGGTWIYNHEAANSTLRINRSSSSTIGTLPATGFIGAARTGASAVTYRMAGINTDLSTGSVTPSNEELLVFQGPTPQIFNGGLGFYSIGEAIDLAKLDTRISTFMTKIGQILA